MVDIVVPRDISKLLHRHAQIKVLLKAYKDMRTSERELIQGCRKLFKKETIELKAFCETEPTLTYEGELAKYKVSIKPAKAKSIKIDLQHTVALIEQTLNDEATNKDQMKNIIKMGLAANIKLPREDDDLRHVRIGVRKNKKATEKLSNSVTINTFERLLKQFLKSSPLNHDNDEEDDDDGEDIEGGEEDDIQEQIEEESEGEGDEDENEDEDIKEQIEEDETEQIVQMADNAIEKIQTRSKRQRTN